MNAQVIGSNDHVLQIAIFAHAGQKRRGIEYYYFHPKRMAAVAEKLQLGDAVIQLCLLHDVVEKTAFTYSDLIRAGVDARVVHLLQFLTIDDSLNEDKMTKAERGGPEVQLVAWLDQLDNLRPIEGEYWEGMEDAYRRYRIRMDKMRERWKDILPPEGLE